MVRCPISHVGPASRKSPGRARRHARGSRLPSCIPSQPESPSSRTAHPCVAPRRRGNSCTCRMRGPSCPNTKLWLPPRPQSRRMHQRQNPHRVFMYFVHQSVALVRNQFAGTWNLAHSAKQWVLGQSVRRLREKLIHAQSGEWVVLPDVVQDIGSVTFRAVRRSGPPPRRRCRTHRRVSAPARRPPCRAGTPHARALRVGAARTLASIHAGSARPGDGLPRPRP